MSVIETEYEKLPPRHRKPWSSSRRDDSLENSSRHSATDSGRSSPSLSPNTSAMPPMKRVYSERNTTGRIWKIDAFSTPEDIEDFLKSPPTSDDSEGGSSSGADDSTDLGSVAPQLQPEPITPKDDSSLISQNTDNVSESQSEMKSDAAGPSTPALSHTPEAPTEIIESSSQATTFQFNTPELSAPNMDPPPLILKHKFPPKLFSESSPSTRSNSPTLRPSGSNPSPSKWISTIPTGSRRSSRRFEVRPWGPRHLEYDYSQARKEFQSAAYYALGQYGYVPPKGYSKTIVSTTDTLPSMADLKKIKAFRKACERLDETDRLLEEALERGQTWDNTPVPKEYMNLALDVDLDSEEMKPENFGVRRVSEKARNEEEDGSEAKRKRSRSSVTLEEEAGSINISTPPTTAPPAKRRGRPPKKKP